jgi:hypothetical protein
MALFVCFVSNSSPFIGDLIEARVRLQKYASLSSIFFLTEEDSFFQKTINDAPN